MFDVLIFGLYFGVVSVATGFGLVFFLLPQTGFKLMDWWFSVIGGGSTAWLRNNPRWRTRVMGFMVFLLGITMLVLPIYKAWQQEFSQTSAPPEGYRLLERSIGLVVGLLFVLGLGLFSLASPTRAARFFNHHLASGDPSRAATTVIRLIGGVMVLLSGYALLRTYWP